MSVYQFKKGIVLTRLHKSTLKTSESFDKALAREPNNVDGLIGKGTVLNNQLSYAQALDCFDKALELEPNNVCSTISKRHSSTQYL